MSRFRASYSASQRDRNEERVPCPWCPPNSRKIANGGLAEHIIAKHLQKPLTEVYSWDRQPEQPT